MYPLEQKIEEQIFKIDKPRPTLIFPEATDERVVLAASSLSHIAHLILLANQDDVFRILKSKTDFSPRRIDYFMNQVKIVDHRCEHELKAIFSNELTHISSRTSWEVSYREAKNLLNQANYFAILAARLGYADAVLGGLTMTLSEFFTPCCRLLRQEPTVFEMAIFALPDEHPDKPYQHNIAVFADVAINTEMNAEKLADIAVGTCRITRDIIPTDALEFIYGAIVSYSTKGSASGSSVEMVREAGRRIPAKLKKLIATDPIYETIKIESELQISCALSEEAAAFKLKNQVDPRSPIGKANVLIAPNLDLGNFLYHIYALRFPDSKRVLMSGGLKNRAIDFSRASTVEDVVLATKALVLSLKKDSNYQHTPKDYFFPRCCVLAINPGSTSTKIAVFKGEIEEFRACISHSTKELDKYKKIVDQFEFRKKNILAELEKHDFDMNLLDGIVGRGGLLAPIQGGTYEVNEKMKNDLINARFSEHASNLGALLAGDLADKYNKRAFIVDPVVVDEMSEKARITGLSEIKRISLWHALNQRSVAKGYAFEMHKLYEEINVIVAHLGGGITVGAHFKGRAVDVTNGVHGEGPFSPERSGGVPLESFLNLVQSKKYKADELKKKIHGRGGLVDLLGTNDLREVKQRVEAGNSYTQLVLDSMIYFVCRQITSFIPAFEGEKIDAILITGGLAYSEYLVAEIKRYLQNLNIDIRIYPGEKELEALRNGALKVLRGEEEAMDYQGEAGA